MGRRILDKTGERLNRLVVLGLSPFTSKYPRWVVRCDCGVEKTLSISALNKGQQSCGCFRVEQSKKYLDQRNGPNHPRYMGGHRNRGSEAYYRKRVARLRRSSVRKGIAAPTLNPDDLRTYVETNGLVCAICRVSESGKKALAIDHCHVTGAFRGLLCGNCNNGLGRFKDDPSLLGAAKNYLSLT